MGDGGWEGRDCGRGDTATWEVWAAVFLKSRAVHGHLDLKCMHDAWWCIWTARQELSTTMNHTSETLLPY